MDELKGQQYLAWKLQEKRERVQLRYKYYEMKQLTRDFGISTPPDMKSWMSCLGWCSKAVDALADRLSFRGMKDDNLNMMEIFRMNNPDVLFDSAILSALIASCSFIYIRPDDSGFPLLEVIDGANATGVMDSVTGMLKEGYAVLERDPETDEAMTTAYFTPEATYYTDRNGDVREFRHNAGYPLLIPVVYKPDAKRPFGHSRITRACMSVTGSAIRTVKRSEISAEFYSYPQKYAVGMSQDAEMMDKWKASMSAMLQFTKDEDGSSPQVGQFQQASMAPHLDQVKLLASLFAGETGLTLDDLGFPTSNPSSAEAIKASHETLRLAARKAQNCFGTGFLNAGFVAACLRDDYPYTRRVMYMTSCEWAPVFEPDATALAAIGDSILKIGQAVPGIMTEEKVRELTGF